MPRAVRAPAASTADPSAAPAVAVNPQQNPGSSHNSPSSPRRSPRIASAAAAAAAAAAATATATAPPSGTNATSAIGTNPCPCSLPCAENRRSGVRAMLVKPKKARKDETKEQFKLRQEKFKTQSDEELIMKQADFFLETGKLPRCQKKYGDAKGWTKCNCLSIFRDNPILSTAVAKALTKRLEILKAISLDRNVLKYAQVIAVNPYKVVEMYTTFRPYLEVKYHEDEFYREPTAEEWAVVKKEKKMNKVKKEEIKKMKREAKEEVVDESVKAKKPRTTDTTGEDVVKKGGGKIGGSG